MQADLRLVCPSGGCAPVDQFERCHVAKSPARAVFSRADMQGSDMGKAVKAALLAGGERGRGKCEGSGWGQLTGRWLGFRLCLLKSAWARAAH